MKSSIKTARRVGPPPRKSEDIYKKEIVTTVHASINKTVPCTNKRNDTNKTCSTSRTSNKEVRTISLEIPVLGLERAVVWPRTPSKLKLRKKIEKNSIQEEDELETVNNIVHISEDKNNSNKKESIKSVVTRKPSPSIVTQNKYSKASVKSNKEHQLLPNHDVKVVHNAPKGNDSSMLENTSKSTVNSILVPSNAIIDINNEKTVKKTSSCASRIPTPKKNQKVIPNKKQPSDLKVNELWKSKKIDQSIKREEIESTSSLNSSSKLGSGVASSTSKQRSTLKTDVKIKPSVEKPLRNQKSVVSAQRLSYVFKSSQQAISNTRGKEKSGIIKQKVATPAKSNQSRSYIKPNTRNEEIKQSQKGDVTFKNDKDIDKLLKDVNDMKIFNKEIPVPKKKIEPSKKNVTKM